MFFHPAAASKQPKECISVLYIYASCKLTHKNIDTTRLIASNIIKFKMRVYLLALQASVEIEFFGDYMTTFQAHPNCRRLFSMVLMLPLGLFRHFCFEYLLTLPEDPLFSAVTRGSHIFIKPN
jgi:hypothetical protein